MLDGAYLTTALREKPEYGLLEQTRVFVQLAFAAGVVEKIDRTVPRRGDKRRHWEKRKWLLVRSVFYNNFIQSELRSYAGVKSLASLNYLYRHAIAMIWFTSPGDLQRQFPLSGLLKGENRGWIQRQMEIRAAQQAREQARDVKTHSKKERLSEATRQRRREAQVRRWRRERDRKMQQASQNKTNLDFARAVTGRDQAPIQKKPSIANPSYG